MALTALSPMAPHWHTPASEEGEESPTRFQIRGLNGNEIAQVVPDVHISNNGDDVSIGHTAMRLCLGFGLLNWENFNDAEGNPVKFFKNPTKNMEKLSYDLQAELAGAIFDASNIGEESAKNS